MSKYFEEIKFDFTIHALGYILDIDLYNFKCFKHDKKIHILTVFFPHLLQKIISGKEFSVFTYDELNEVKLCSIHMILKDRINKTNTKTAIEYCLRNAEKPSYKNIYHETFEEAVTNGQIQYSLFPYICFKTSLAIEPFLHSLYGKEDICERINDSIIYLWKYSGIENDEERMKKLWNEDF